MIAIETPCAYRPSALTSAAACLAISVMGGDAKVIAHFRYHGESGHEQGIMKSFGCVCVGGWVGGGL